jgi:ribose transport system permease protein
MEEREQLLSEHNAAERGGASPTTVAPAADAAPSRDAPSVRDLGRRALAVESNSVLAATVALILFIGILHPDFLTWGQLKEVVQNAAYVGIIAAGMAFLISLEPMARTR